MGSCLSKKSTNSSSPTAFPTIRTEQIKAIPQPQVEKKKVQEEPVKKEIFVIKHRRSHEVERRSEEEKGEVKKAVNDGGEAGKTAQTSPNVLNGVMVAAPVRTSSCTKEEVDAILIQCGRLSRSSSTGKAGLSGSAGGSCENNGSSQRGKRYCGSKRSFDFDNENNDGEVRKGDGSEENEEDPVAAERVHRHRQRHRSRTPGSPSQGRRRTPSREREPGQQRSGSRERGTSGSGRRISRSPGRRSESPITISSGVGNANNSSTTARPQKMISVPATITSLSMDKSNNASGGGEHISSAAIKRIQVKRNVGCDSTAGARTAASPRARSPARTNNVRASNENQNVQNQQQPMSLSRSNSRKNEQSPYRRNPLSDIDTNMVPEHMHASGFKAANNVISQASAQKLNADSVTNSKVGVHSKVIMDKKPTSVNGKVMEHNKLMAEETMGMQSSFGNVAVNVVISGPESLKPPQGLTRSRSSRISRDLDINPEALTNANPSYTSILLEDIQNFHQKNTPAVTLPACVNKARSILEAVADLNSSSGSNISSAFSENKRRNPMSEKLDRKDENNSTGAYTAGMRKLSTKEPFVESEVVVADDLMEPSLHKYVTVRRGSVEGGEMEEQESSGSNSFVGSQQHWVSSSSWEPNSADSTDRWTSSTRSNGKEEEFNPLGFQRNACSDTVHEVDETRRKLVVKRRDADLQQNGIGRGRVGPRGQYTIPTTAAICE